MIFFAIPKHCVSASKPERKLQKEAKTQTTIIFFKKKQKEKRNMPCCSCCSSSIKFIVGNVSERMYLWIFSTNQIIFTLKKTAAATTTKSNKTKLDIKLNKWVRNKEEKRKTLITKNWEKSENLLKLDNFKVQKRNESETKKERNPTIRIRTQAASQQAPQNSNKNNTTKLLK